MNEKSLKYFLTIFFLVVFKLIAYSQATAVQVTIVLSLDGFRWDYPNKVHTPVLDSIASNGVKAVSLVPSFPTKTFPNHYTLATGLVPDHHGLVNNTFFNENTNQTYAIENNVTRYNPHFYGGEPIWVTAQKQNVNTASFFWVGSELPIQGIQPRYWKKYDQSISFAERIDTIISWLQLPEPERPRLVMAYYHEPDGVGHDYGPNDATTLHVVHDLDSLVGVLCSKISKLPISKSINLIVLSDHGMGEIDPLKHVTLRDYIPVEWPIRIVGGNPNFNLYAASNWVDSCYSKLKSVTNISVWKPANVPSYLNYGSNPLVGNLIIVADSSCSVSVEVPKTGYSKATHGYSFRNPDMHAIFYAIGPAFKKNYIHPSFSNVNVYKLLAHLIGIQPVKTDGSFFEVKEMLK